MTDKKHINENDLEELLKSLYLEENSKTANDDAAEFVMAQDYDININAAKEKALIKKLQKKSGGFGGYKLYFSVAIVVVVTVCLTFYFKQEPQIKTNAHDQTPIDEIGTISPENNLQTNGYEKTGVEKTNAIKVNVPRDTFGRVRLPQLTSIKDSANMEIKETPAQVVKNAENVLPFITEQDKVKYTKVKNLMLKKLIKADKALYSHIEADKMIYCGKSFITDAYTLRNMGITNLEYKTFLADLLIQYKKNEYLAAQVLCNNWTFFGSINLAATYFQDEKYNDYPVVNITMEGANLFCKWLEEEIKIYYVQNNLKVKPLQVRLPFDYEWLYAARQGYTRVPIEGEYNTIFDANEGLVDKNSFKRIKFTRASVKRKDTLYDLSSVNHYGWNEKELLELFGKGFKYYSAIPNDTIYSERMKIYGKVGHVSEIVNEKKTGLTWYIGALWKSKEDYIKLQNEFINMKASPFIGFRPVIINSNDPEYKNPFR